MFKIAFPYDLPAMMFGGSVTTPCLYGRTKNAGAVGGFPR